MKRQLCILLISVAPVLANAASTSGAEERPLDLALSLGKFKTTFDYAGGASIGTTVEFIEVNWYERFAEGLEIGLHAGKAFVTQTDRGATAGLEPDGYQAGFGIRATFLPTFWAQPFINATYIYRRVTHDDTNQSVTLTWSEPTVTFGVASEWKRLRLYGGGIWSAVDGRERTTGITPSTNDFDAAARVGGFLGVELAVEQDGRVGVEVFSGTTRGVEISFKKRY